MLRKGAPVVLIGAAFLLGCSPNPRETTVHASMTQVISPTAQTIWQVTDRAFNFKGDGLDPSKISAADWVSLEAAGARLKDEALALAHAHHVSVTGRGQAIMGEDGAAVPSQRGRAWDPVTARQVQAWIDKNPALFSQRARVLAEAGQTIVGASRAKDARTLYQVSSGLDDVCDGCHQRFWGTDEPPPFPG